MKKLFVGFVSAIVLTTGFGASSHAENVKPINNPKLEAEIAQLQAELYEENKVGIARDDVGYIVLDTVGNTVVTKVTKEFTCGSNVVNVFDKKDTIFIDQRYKKGTILLVTFDGDQIVKVKKNDKNVANKVIGQKIVKKTPVFTYKIGKTKGKSVTATAMADFSPENKTLKLKKNSVKGGLKKGDVVLVKFSQYYGDEIKSIKKVKTW